MKENNETKTVKTNIGEMPIEDYRDIVAMQYGYEDYEALKKDGYTLSV